MRTRWTGNIFIYLIVFVGIIAVLFMLFSSEDPGEEVDLTTILTRAANGEIRAIEVDGDRLIVTPRLSPNQQLVASKEPGTSIYEILQSAGIDPVERDIRVEVLHPSGFGNLFGIFLQFLPLIFFGGILLFMMAAGPGKQQSGPRVRQEPRPPLHEQPPRRHVLGRRRRRRVQGRAAGGRRVPEIP